jgi:hypothetical protein
MKYLPFLKNGCTFAMRNIQKQGAMATYQIHVNENISVGRNLIELLRSMPETVSFEPPVTRAKPARSKLHKDLECSFREVKEIMDNQRKRVTIDEFLDELRNSND